MMTHPLRAERYRRGWSQTDVAKALGVSGKTVSRWELGLVLPYPYHIDQLCILFGKDAKELGLHSAINEHDIVEEYPSVQPAVPDIPEILSSVNSLVGREEVFTQVREHLLTGHHVALTALDGLPGIGKTALAVAVARDQQIRAHFHDGILWAGLGPYPDTLGQLACWGKILGIAPSQLKDVNSQEAWGQALREAISARHMLLVIDDARRAEDALALRVGGAACTYLLTTRLSQVASAFAQEGTIVIPQLAVADGLALLASFIPHLVQQDIEEIRDLVRALDGLPLALTLMGKYLASQSFTEEPGLLRSTVMGLREIEEGLLMGVSIVPEEGSGNGAEDIPLCLHAVIALCDQRLSPQAYTALRALSVFPPKPNRFSKEAALAASQQPVEALDELWDAGLLENWGSERYALHQTVADYIYAQEGEASTAQKRRVSPLLEKDVQEPEPRTQKPEAPRLPRPSLQKRRLRTSSMPVFRAFKRFSSHPWLTLSMILLTVVVITTVLPIFNILLPHKSAQQKDYYDYGPPTYSLRILSTDPSMQVNTPKIQYFLQAFEAVYPHLANRFALNPSLALKDMVLTYSSSFSSQVSVSGTAIFVSPDWLVRLPNDIGLLTHELTLFVEHYPSGAPAWFSSGIADYARSVYGPADDDDWSLPNGVQPTDSYMQGGKVAARFLLWLESHTRLDIVDQLNHALQTRQSFSAAFHHLTHHTVDELWSQYQKDPDIELTPEQLYKTFTSGKPIYQSSSLHMLQAPQARTRGLEGLGEVSVSNFALQADITILSGEGGGFVFRRNANTQYRFNMTSYGTFDLVNQTNGGAAGLSPAIRQGFNQTNRVAIIAQKHTIYVFINGQCVMEVNGESTYINGRSADELQGSSSSYGSIALMAYAAYQPTEVQFENVQVF